MKGLLISKHCKLQTANIYIYDEVTSTTIRSVDFLQRGRSTSIAPVEACDNPGYVPPQERKELFNLYKVSITLTKNY